MAQRHGTARHGTARHGTARHALALTCLIAFASSAHAQILASSGFNDVSGINGDGIQNNLPFNVNNTSVNGQGTGEPGWFQPWMFSSSSPTVVNSGQAEGDGALFFSGTSGAQRILAQPLSGVRT